MTTKKRKETLLTGVSFAVLAAVLFGASTPFSKILLSKTEPVLLAGLLYLGSGVGPGYLILVSFPIERRHPRGAVETV